MHLDTSASLIRGEVARNEQIRVTLEVYNPKNVARWGRRVLSGRTIPSGARRIVGWIVVEVGFRNSRVIREIMKPRYAIAKSLLALASCASVWNTDYFGELGAHNWVQTLSEEVTSTT
jgi:hypothetical protein